MIDSGSNSSLFPLPLTLNKKFDINGLLKNFSHEKYIWSIGTAYGVGLLPDTTLHIKPKQSNDLSLCTIKCCLHVDIKPLPFELPYIRFSLDKEAMIILVETSQISFSEADNETLRNTLSFFNEFEKHFSSITNTRKREYCLLGQHFLRNLCTIQVNDIMVFIDINISQQKLFPVANASINEIADYLHFQRPSFSKTEQFLMFEDDEHGGRDLLNISGKIIDVDEC